MRGQLKRNSRQAELIFPTLEINQMPVLMSLEWAGGGGQRDIDHCISANKEHVSLWCGLGPGFPA